MNSIEVSNVRKLIIKKMHEASFTVTDIAQVMSLSVLTVSRYVK